MKFNTVILALVLALPCTAQERFWDKKQAIGFTASVAVRGADAGQTCYHLGEGWHENWGPTQSCAGIVVWTMAGQAGQLIAQYVLFRLHHKRHTTLERLLPLSAGFSAAGVAYSFHNER